MKNQTSWTTPEAVSPKARDVPGCALLSHEVPGVGRVVTVELSGRRDPGFWQGVRDTLGQEVPRRSPDYLVFDLRRLDGLVGSAFLGGLVAGAIEMKRLGRLDRTRLVATGEMAEKLARSIALCKLEPVLGRVHETVTAAVLTGTAP